METQCTDMDQIDQIQLSLQEQMRRGDANANMVGMSLPVAKIMWTVGHCIQLTSRC